MFARKPALIAIALVACLMTAPMMLRAQAPSKPAPAKASRNKPRLNRSGSPSKAAQSKEKNVDTTLADGESQPAKLEKATFGSGCFWCSEAVFQQIKGVHSVVSGYSGGIVEQPTYEQVCTGQTGHAEVIQISYDPNVITFADLLEVFWQTHDPTTLNQQGNDIGTQYRSVIFYHTPEQKRQAEHYKQKLDQEHAFRRPIVTEITAFAEFYPAEDYHRDYYNQHKGQGYCMAVIRPKVSKVKKVFHDKLKQ